VEGASAPILVPEFRFGTELTIKDFGRGPYGHRQLVHGSGGGKVTGSRIQGQLVPPGGDWYLIGDDQCGRLDCRANIRTDDDVLIYMEYLGVLVLTPDVNALFEGSADVASASPQEFFTTPRLETGSENYAWVNRTVFVGQGRISAGPRVDYTVFRVVDSSQPEDR
jgi:uncharacterized protein DUF3237